MVFKFKLKEIPGKPALNAVRFFDIVLWAPSNYVYVFIRNKTEPSGIRYDFKGDDWTFETCHDSCWRDRMGSILNDYGDRIESIQVINSYDKIKIPDDVAKEFRAARERSLKDNSDMFFGIGV